MGEHPAIKWIGIATAVLSLLGLASTVVWYFEDDRVRQIQWLKDDVQWNESQISSLAAILERQEEIQRELATQTLRLDALDVLINRHWKQREDRFEELELLHTNLLTLLAERFADFSYRMGKHDGRHHAGE